MHFMLNISRVCWRAKKMNAIKIQLSGQIGSFILQADLYAENLTVLGIGGHSAAGKTMLLRGIAGFERSFKGIIKINNATWLDTNKNIELPPYQRRAGYVFQEPRLLPYLTVEKNLQFANTHVCKDSLYMQKSSILSCLDLTSLLNRYPHELSGGQQQRVAIARAILSNPSILMMDEPLAHLNKDLKNDIMMMIINLTQEFKGPILYVSHDETEISRLASHITHVVHGKFQPITTCCTTKSAAN